MIESLRPARGTAGEVFPDRPSTGHRSPQLLQPAAIHHSSCPSNPPIERCGRHGLGSCDGNRVAGTHPTESLCDSGQQGILRFLKRLDRHLARDRGKLAQELTQRMAALDIVDQAFERNSGARKQGVPFMTSGSITIADSPIAFHCTVHGWLMAGTVGAGLVPEIWFTQRPSRRCRQRPLTEESFCSLSGSQPCPTGTTCRTRSTRLRSAASAAMAESSVPDGLSPAARVAAAVAASTKVAHLRTRSSSSWSKRAACGRAS